ncbi:AmmeMemoRadiSam system radical SAM enzyme [Moorena producens PAL-8-15-08-1]|uniref:AmmeMemoRadiSam system radical SAM enzyme n=1 Tax=Moorena producens PAL-8-15-08-1 TaxID=1458985 RepID=A0A1D8TKU3_9CYAN|nr:AmmeMemoRadiSam system radical SAM enzyme [Moorena producens]AOW98261.1 AmmeMemoRadiSam system radical SAM enzyme [Moorena producens PAL-8-15-08-1]
MNGNTYQLNNPTKAMLYQKQEEGSVLCQLCPHYCLIPQGKRGICQVRENRGGSLYTLVFGRTVTQNIDGVEKKPLFHFYPGSTTYSIATSGCNFHCQYCTNWQVSQMSTEEFAAIGVEASAEKIVAAALQVGCRSLAYTYVEPTIFFEYVHAIATLAHKAGLFNLFKTNGFMSKEMLDVCQSYLNAANVDLKAFRDQTYRQFGGRLQPVLDSLKFMKSLGIWLEVTTVVIPGINDESGELEDIAGFIAQELGIDTPWHITRFFPAYKMEDVPPTPIETLYQARDIGLAAGLRYVYFGNFLEKGKQDTVCPNCGEILIKRHGFKLLENKMLDNHCPSCGTLIPGIGLADQISQNLT